MTRDKKAVVTNTQTEILCTFFEQNPETIRGYRKLAHCIDAVQRKWQQITPQLNAHGPARDHRAWAKYLCNIKAKLKTQQLKWKQKDNGPIICNAEQLTEIKLRMLQVLKNDAFNSEDNSDSPTSDIDIDESINDNDQSNNNDLIDVQQNNTKTNVFTHPVCIKIDQTDNLSPPLPQQLSHAPVNKNEKLDEFDVFGRNIAMQLRTLPIETALETQEMLLSVLKKQRIIFLNRKSKLTDPLNKYN